MTSHEPISTSYGGMLRPRTEPASEARVAALEARLHCQLPEQYRSFLLTYNGGRVSPAGFVFAERTGPYTDSLVHALYSLYDGDLCNLQKALLSRNGRMPDGVIPIGNDPGGNAICLVLTGDRRGQVWFWDHEREPETQPDWSNMDLIAPSFDAFMRGLTADE